MRSCVLTYLYHFYCICIWSDCCTITWNSITYLHGLVNVFILYFMSFHNISVGLRSELWLGSSKKSHFMLEYCLLEWIFCLAFLQNPVWGIQLLDEICSHFCFQTLEKSPNVGQGPQLVSCNSSNTQQECAVDVRGGGYKTADDCLNEHWIRLRLLAVRIKCHSVILG